jgi:hypothetical protein
MNWAVFLVNRQDCTHCQFYLKDTPFQNDAAKIQLFHKPARGGENLFLLRDLQMANDSLAN